MNTTRVALIVSMAFMLLASGCKNKNDRSFNIFTISDEKTLGLQVSNEIASDPATYPLLSETQYPQAYTYLRNLRDKILAGGKVFYKNEFAWELYIIEDDNTLNAFCTPGGYIYVYTGLIKYLDSEDELAGVLGHEMAHADRRHSTDQLTRVYGIGTLISIVLGNNQNQLTDIAQNLLTLGFSRSDETEADKYSVIYLCPTNLNATGAAGFFEKIEAQGGTNIPQFLSTHPNPDNRIAKINAVESDEGLTCSGSLTNDAAYAAFKASLP
jgi:beta-barrel assembly-enhancing protease